jgi:hypothetical protein
MAKRKRSKGKRRGGKRKSKKGSRKSAKHSMALEGSIAWDAYKVATADMSGQTVGHRLVGAITDPAQRGALRSPGVAKQILLANTKEVQIVALLKLGQKIPVVKLPVNMAVNALNSLGKQLGIKGKYKVF